MTTSSVPVSLSPEEQLANFPVTKCPPGRAENAMEWGQCVSQNHQTTVNSTTPFSEMPIVTAVNDDGLVTAAPKKRKTKNKDPFISV
jgi:hypothetical protein